MKRPAQSVHFRFDKARGSYPGVKLQVHRDCSEASPPLFWREVLQLWAHEDSFRSDFNEQIARIDYADFFWEAVPVTGQTASQTPFECVVLDARGSLGRRRASCQDFAEHTDRAGSSSTVISFPNLGRDASLIVPVPLEGTPDDAYGNLAAFTRAAPPEQQHELWRTVAVQMLRQLDGSPTRPLWLGTDGRGVPWLHVRLDARAKYTKCPDYQSAPAHRRGSLTPAANCADAHAPAIHAASAPGRADVDLASVAEQWLASGAQAVQQLTQKATELWTDVRDSAVSSFAPPPAEPAARGQAATHTRYAQPHPSRHAAHQRSHHSYGGRAAIPQQHTAMSNAFGAQQRTRSRQELRPHAAAPPPPHPSAADGHAYYSATRGLHVTPRPPAADARGGSAQADALAAVRGAQAERWAR